MRRLSPTLPLSAILLLGLAGCVAPAGYGYSGYSDPYATYTPEPYYAPAPVYVAPWFGGGGGYERRPDRGDYRERPPEPRREFRREEARPRDQPRPPQPGGPPRQGRPPERPGDHNDQGGRGEAR